MNESNLKTSWIYKNKLPAGLFFAGAVLFLAGLVFYSPPQADEKFKDQPQIRAVEAAPTSWGEPATIKIPQLAIDAKVEKSWIVDGVWELKKDAVSYLAQGGRMGEKGNAIFYAHNTRSLFKNLVKAEVGQTINIETDRGKSREYAIKEVKIVKPTDVYILEQGEREEITIYTCTGFKNTKRLVVKAEPTNS